MRHKFTFKPEPFPRHGRFGGLGLFDTETPSAWLEETSRQGADYIRWVQSSLNNLLGLRLAVDGIEGPSTRSAIRSFQQQQGLTVDGIVGLNTEAALIAVGAPQPPTAASATSAGLPSRKPLPPECSAGTSANCVVLYDFAFNDDSLTATHQEQIASIARRIIVSQETSAPIKSLLILGHASPEGPYHYNIDLALRRATEAEFALVDCMESIKPGSSRPSLIKLDVKSCGEEKIPDVSDPAKQRRVDVCFPLESRVSAVTLGHSRWFETGGTPYMPAMQPVREGNDVQYLTDGEQTFEAMWRAILTAQNSEHYIYLLGWWLNDDLELKQEYPDSTIHRLFTKASGNSVQLRAMLWDYPAIVGMSPQNFYAVNHINALQHGAAILDGRTLNFGSHHQKVLIVKGTEGLIAFCGGIDINPDRIRDTGRNLGEPFHDVHSRVKGPAAFDLLKIFLERWRDHPKTKALDSAKGPLSGWSEPVPAPLKDAAMYVQIARTYGNGTRHRGIPGYTFAPNGERTACRMIVRAIREARRFIYIEDQYLVSQVIRDELLKALPRIKHLTILIPHGDITDLNPAYPMLSELRDQVYYRRQLFIAPLLAASPSKVGVFYLSPAGDLGTYVHSKAMVVDDEFAIIGSFNLSRRSLTHDSEAVVGIYDASCDSLAKRLRVALWSKHLNINIDETTPEGRQGRDKLADGVKSARLWYLHLPGSHVAVYNKANARVEPKLPGADEEWNLIDPDGS